MLPCIRPFIALTVFFLLVNWSSSFPYIFGSVFDVVEECPIGTLIDGVAEYLRQVALLHVEMPNSTTFQLLGTDQLTKCLVIDPSSGELRTRSRVNRETVCNDGDGNEQSGDSSCFKLLNILIKSQSTGGGIPERSFRQQIKLRIVDINDNAPKWPGKNSLFVKFLESFQSPASYGKQEMLTESRILERAFDPDAGPNGTVSYALKGPGADMFDLENAGTENARFGQLSAEPPTALRLRPVVAMDREAFAVYNLTLVAFDSGQPALSSSIALNIFITDVNDHAPVFHSPTSDHTSSFQREHKQGDLVKYVPPRGHLPETAPVGSLVLTLNATDSDLGANSKITYSISPGDESSANAYFLLDAVTGHLTVKQRLDYDAGPRRFNFKVIAMDGAPEPYRLTGTAIVDIELTDVNDEPPTIEILIAQNINNGLNTPSTPQTFNQQELMAYIEENASPDLVIAYVQVSDKDENGEDQVRCTLGSQDNFTLQSETLPHTSKAYHFGLRESASKKVTEYRILAKVPTLYAPFNQQASTHNLQNCLDRETTPSQLLTITCFDRAENQAERRIRVNFLDVNDNAPRFINNSQFNFSITENREPSASQHIWIGRVHAVDPDFGDNARLTYHLAPDQHQDSQFAVNTHQLFRVKADTGDIYVQVSLDRENAPENGVYTMQVLAIDNGKPIQLTGTARVDVHVLDVNDCAPEFTRDIYTFVIPEDIELRGIVGTVEAIDGDATASPKSISYHLNLPRPGFVKRSIINDTFDRVKRNAVDELTPPQPQQQPLFMPHLETSKLQEDRPQSYFSIDSRTGEIRVIRKIDRESNPYFTFEVLAIDSPLIRSSQPQQQWLQAAKGGVKVEVFTATATVVVTLTDVNDNGPEFRYPNTSILLHMAQGETLGHKLLTVHAVDRDDGENASISYKIRSEIPIPPDGPGTGNFAIDETSGLIFLTRPIHGPVNHRLVVEACDHGRVPKCTSSPGIQIAVSEDAKLRGVGQQQRDSVGGLAGTGSLLESSSDQRYGYEAFYGSGSGLYDHGAPHRIEVIAACLVVVFGVLLLAAVVLVCLLKRKPEPDGVQGNDNHVCTALWSCRWPIFKQQKDTAKQAATPHYVPSHSQGNFLDTRFSEGKSPDASLVKGMLSPDSITNTLDVHMEDGKPLYYDGLGILTSEHTNGRGEGQAQVIATSPSGMPISRALRQPSAQTVVFTGNAAPPMPGQHGSRLYGTLPVISTLLSDGQVTTRQAHPTHQMALGGQSKFMNGMPLTASPPSPDYQSLDQMVDQIRNCRGEIWQNQPRMDVYTSQNPQNRHSSSYGCLIDTADPAVRRQHHHPTHHNYYEISPLTSMEVNFPVRSGSQKQYQRSATLGRLVAMDESIEGEGDFLHHSSAGVLAAVNNTTTTTTNNNNNNRSYSQLQATTCLNEATNAMDHDKPARYTYQAIREASFV